VVVDEAQAASTPFHSIDGMAEAMIACVVDEQHKDDDGEDVVVADN